MSLKHRENNLVDFHARQNLFFRFIPGCLVPNAKQGRMRGSDSLKPKDFLILLLLTAGAFVIAGYHPGVEDAEIYVPGIKKVLNPVLYPFGSEFFQSHARLTLYPNLIAASVRLTHLSLDSVMLLWHMLSIFLVLLACWKLSGLCFHDARARWGGVALIAALLTIPVAGTALYIVDEYLNPRALALCAALFAIGAVLKRRYFAATVWTLLVAPLHPLMSVFGVSLSAVIIWLRDFTGSRAMPATARPAPSPAAHQGESFASRIFKCAMEHPAVIQGFRRLASAMLWRERPNNRGPRVSVASVALAALLIPLGVSLRLPSRAYQDAIQLRPYFFILRWHWYEYLGIFAPLLLLWWLGRLARKRQMNNASLLCRSCFVYALVYFAIALLTTIPPHLLALVRYQPMRSLQLVYVVLFLIGGGFLGKWVLRDRAWRWLVLFLPLCLGMFYGQRQLFPATPHIEWPGRVPQNDWLQAFAWIRANTPTNAVFALNPEHMALPGEDQHGFRALAERSMLADAVKDSGALTMFPDLPLAEHWKQQIEAQQGWANFQAADFERLRRDWDVTWVVLDQRNVTGLDCPYANPTLQVCRVESRVVKSND